MRDSDNLLGTTDKRILWCFLSMRSMGSLIVSEYVGSSIERSVLIEPTPFNFCLRHQVCLGLCHQSIQNAISLKSSSLVSIAESFTTSCVEISPIVKMSERALTAEYASPSGSQTFTRALPALDSDPSKQSVPDKTAYLSGLRSAITQMQTDVNEHLTAKMEEDKASAKTDSSRDVKEEENYGEEDPEDDG